MACEFQEFCDDKQTEICPNHQQLQPYVAWANKTLSDVDDRITVDPCWQIQVDYSSASSPSICSTHLYPALGQMAIQDMCDIHKCYFEHYQSSTSHTTISFNQPLDVNNNFSKTYKTAKFFNPSIMHCLALPINISHAHFDDAFNEIIHFLRAGRIPFFTHEFLMLKLLNHEAGHCLFVKIHHRGPFDWSSVLLGCNGTIGCMCHEVKDVHWINGGMMCVAVAHLLNETFIKWSIVIFSWCHFWIYNF